MPNRSFDLTSRSSRPGFRIPPTLKFLLEGSDVKIHRL